MVYMKQVWVAADGTYHETEKEANVHEAEERIVHVIIKEGFDWRDCMSPFAPTALKIAVLLLKHFVIYPKPEVAVEEDA
jgi:hypothetical protein